MPAGPTFTVRLGAVGEADITWVGGRAPPTSGERPSAYRRHDAGELMDFTAEYNRRARRTEMRARSSVRTMGVAMILAGVTGHVSALGPGRCPNDSKLLNGGPTLVYGEGPGTWWGLVIDGLDAAGFDSDGEKVDYLNGLFGTSFATLDELKTYNLGLVASGWDANQNSYVCAFELRGTRAYSGVPLIDTTSFGISDDKVSNK
jgi:hypothetical protein